MTAPPARRPPRPSQQQAAPPIEPISLGREPDTNPHRNEAGSDGAVRRLGRSFMLAFHGAIRAIKLYPVENAAVIKALEELTTSTHALIQQEHELEFRTSGEFIFINAT